MDIIPMQYYKDLKPKQINLIKNLQWNLLDFCGPLNFNDSYINSKSAVRTNGTIKFDIVTYYPSAGPLMNVGFKLHPKMNSATIEYSYYSGYSNSTYGGGKWQAYIDNNSYSPESAGWGNVSGLSKSNTVSINFGIGYTATGPNNWNCGFILTKLIYKNIIWK